MIIDRIGHLIPTKYEADENGKILRLICEDDEGNETEVSREELDELIRECRILSLMHRPASKIYEQ